MLYMQDKHCERQHDIFLHWWSLFALALNLVLVLLVFLGAYFGIGSVHLH